jgi:Lon protease-like protein
MASQERSLPLFPLNTVLFPNASLPLQIFEERYKLMLQHCLSGDSTFGVVLIKSGSEVGAPAVPYSVGTVAQIVQVNRVQEGRIFVSVLGRQRFRVSQITQYQPYIAAQVELLEEEVEPGLSESEAEEVRLAATQYVRLLLGLRGGWMRQINMPSGVVELSYFIAGMLQADLQEKQALLEEPSASKRLAAELALLRRETGPLKQRVAYELRHKFSRQ